MPLLRDVSHMLLLLPCAIYQGVICATGLWYSKPEHDSVTRFVQIALDALLAVYSDQDWQQSFGSLANKVTAVGPSHRAHLVALKFLPAHSPRGFALQQAAAASLLQGLCTLSSKVCSPDFIFMSCMPVMLLNVQWL